MTTKKDTRRFTALKARVEKTGYKLLRDASDTMYLLDPTRDRLDAINLDYKGLERELKSLEDPKTQEDLGLQLPERMHTIKRSDWLRSCNLVTAAKAYLKGCEDDVIAEALAPAVDLLELAEDQLNGNAS
jgi:hypothetical protein